MNWLSRYRLASTALLLGMLCLFGGCTADAASITLLDVLNTVFLGITAAGGIVLIQNI